MALVGRSTSLAASTYDWPQFDGNAQHSGNDALESAITTGNVSTLQYAFTAQLAGNADGAPAYLAGVSTPTGVKDVFFVTTTGGTLLALDAHTGATIWSKTTSGASGATTSSPAVDPNRQYVYSYGMDGKVHKYQVGDGTEITTGGWPEVATLKPDVEKGSSALSVASTPSGNFLYVTNSGYPGDCCDYQGHLTAINLATGTRHVFNSLCSNQVDVHFLENTSPDCAQRESGIWARSGAVYDPDTNKIYLSTGNATFAPNQYDWGDTVLALNPDGTGKGGGLPLDSFTPADYQYLDTQDLDLGSTAPAILPVPATSKVQHLAVQGGKGPSCSTCSGVALWLLNLDNLSGQGGQGHVGGEVGSFNLPQDGEILTAPAVWVNPADNSTWVFVANGNGLSGLKLVVDGSGNPTLQSMWVNGDYGNSAVVANGVLFEAGGAIRAFDPVTGHQLWSDTRVSGLHWQSPIVANGMVYVENNNRQVIAYALPTAPAASLQVTAPNSATAGASFSVTVTARDVAGNVSTGYRGTVHFTSTDPQGVLPANYTFTANDNGAHTFTNVTLKTAGSQTVSASDTGNTSMKGTSGAISVGPGSPTKILVTGPSSVTSGTSFSVQVTSQDVYGNTTPAYTGTVSWTSSDVQASLPANYTFVAGDQGSHTFTNVILKSGGAQTITATDTATASITGTANVTVNTVVTVQYAAMSGWNLVGGSPLTIWSDAQAAWSWNALNGQWTFLSSTSQTQPQGSGAWEELAASKAETVSAQVCSGAVSVIVVPHRWNMVGNPCSVAVTLPAGTRALSWNGSSYVVVSTIGPGAAAWVFPSSNPLALSP